MREPKYRQLMNQLKARILSGEWPENARLMTETQMAEVYGVGRQTVRQALELLAEERLIYRKQGSGTFVSPRGSAGKPSRLVGMITTFASYYIFPDILGSIEDNLRANDCRILLSVTQNHFGLERSILQDMLKQPIDGLIVECTCPQVPNPNIDLYRRIRQMGIPVVFLNAEYVGLEDCVSVQVDDEGAGYALTKRMIGLGARAFGGLFRADYHGYRRFKGFYKACTELDARVDEDVCRWFSDNEGKETLGYLLGSREIERLDRLDALVCYNDAVAINTMEHLWKQGCSRLPRLACFDNTQILKLSREPVTAITYPSRAVGACVVSKLINMIRGAAETSVVLPWETEWDAADDAAERRGRVL